MIGISKRENKSDFKVLENAADQMTIHLRNDEGTPDLYNQFREPAGEDGNHEYFLEPYQSVWDPMLEHKGFVPIPPTIKEQFRRVSCGSFMGIFPEINRAWISVDNRLFLWDYLSPNDFLSYDGLSEVIVSVCLAVPRPGVFLDVVKYILVVATPVEIVLLAITWNEDNRAIRLQHTKYAIPSDDVTMLKTVSTQNGRIFMAGNDGNMYELVYENLQDSWATYMGLGEPHKCRKINHSSWHIVNVIPPVIKGLIGWDDVLVDMVIDDLRYVLYTISSRGNISMFYLGEQGTSTPSCRVSGFNIFSSTRDFLTNRVGGNSSVLPDASIFYDVHNLSVVNIHVVSMLESKSVNLVAILSNGIRVYISSVNSSEYATSVTEAPTSLRVVHARKPPPVKKGGAVRVRSAYYSCGVFMSSVSASGGVDDAGRQDILLGVTEDLIARKGVRVSGQRPSMREAVCTVDLHHSSSEGSGRSNSSESSGEGRIHDIKETCPQLYDFALSRMRTLASVSGTGQNAPKRAPTLDIKRSGFAVLGIAPKEPSPEPPPGPSPCQAFAYREQGTGISYRDLLSVTRLGELYWQHLPVPSSSTQRQILCLTTHGIHVINKTRPCDYLERILSKRTAGQEYLTHAQTFFQYFGATQAGAMCVGLACGIPADFGGSEGMDSSVYTAPQGSDAIRRRAMSVLLQLGGTAAYRIAGGVSGSQYTAQFARHNEFTPSASYTAVCLFASRILRPIWFRSLIYYDKSSSSTIATATGLSGARRKPMFLLKRSDLNNIREPLTRLLGVLREYFSSSIRRNTADIVDGRVVNGTPIDGAIPAGSNSKSSILLKQLHMNSHASRGEDEASLDIDARRIEDHAFNALYRLLSRSSQALALFDILLTAENTHHIKVDWSRLADEPFSTLVIDPRVHDTVKRLVNDLLQTQSSASILGESANAATSLATHIADEITQQLSKHCYLWFSAGDKYLYEGLKALMAGHTAPLDSTERASYISQTGMLLCKAARYWRSLGDVSGEGSVLWDTCSQLITLGGEAPERVVDVCMVASESFGGGKMASRVNARGGAIGMATIAGISGHVGAEGEQEDWERGLYHGGGVHTDEDKKTARKACYDCLLNEVRRVRVSPDRLGGGIVTVQLSTEGHFDTDNSLEHSPMARMISHALATSDDEMFHHQLYNFLMDIDKEQLVYIQSRHIENFLREKDPLLLYRHYSWHGRHAQAAYLMDLLAHDDEEVEIGERIEHIIRAVNSATRACSSSEVGSTVRSMSSTGSDIVTNYSYEKLEDLKDKLQIAELQREVKSTLESQLRDIDAVRSRNPTQQREGQRQRDQLADVVHRLKFYLLDVSELYNKIAVPYNLWESSLIILYTCKHDDAALVVRLWKSIIYRIIPNVASNIDTQEFLHERRKSNIMIDKRGQKTSVRFEEHRGWLPELQERILELGSRFRIDSPIHGGAQAGVQTSSVNVGGRTCFPVLALLEELEEVTAEAGHALADSEQGDSFDRRWVYMCLLRAGVGHGELLECYMDAFRRWQGKKALLQLSSSAAAVTLDWAKICAGFSAQHSLDSRQFMMYARSGKIRSWLAEISQYLNRLSGPSLSSTENALLKAARNDVADAEQRLAALLLSRQRTTIQRANTELLVVFTSLAKKQVEP